MNTHSVVTDFLCQVDDVLMMSEINDLPRLADLMKLFETFS